MDDGMPGEIEARRAAAVEHMDAARIADAEEGVLERRRVADPQDADLRLVERHGEGVVGHGWSLHPYPSTGPLRGPLRMRRVLQCDPGSPRPEPGRRPESKDMVASTIIVIPP